MKTCEDCRFYHYHGDHEGKSFGFCFRYPPTVLAENKSSQPVTMEDKPACGEFRRKGWFK